MAAAAASRRPTSAGDCSGGAWRLRKAARRAAPLVRTVLALAVLALTAAAPPARAQVGPPYAATPPTFGALYHDGPTDRWLLGGAWL